MKLKLIKSIVVLFIIVVSSIGIYYSSSKTSTNNLLFENIEALASGEGSIGGYGCRSGGYACALFDSNYYGIFHSLNHYPVSY